jgi:hypothetical protein
MTEERRDPPPRPSLPAGRLRAARRRQDADIPGTQLPDSGTSGPDGPDDSAGPAPPSGSWDAFEPVPRPSDAPGSITAPGSLTAPDSGTGSRAATGPGSEPEPLPRRVPRSTARARGIPVREFRGPGQPVRLPRAVADPAVPSRGAFEPVRRDPAGDPETGAIDRNTAEQVRSQERGTALHERRRRQIPNLTGTGPDFAVPSRGAFVLRPKAAPSRAHGYPSRTAEVPPGQEAPSGPAAPATPTALPKRTVPQAAPQATTTAAPASPQRPPVPPDPIAPRQPATPPAPAGTAVPGEPSWPAVMANTARLWARRRADRRDGPVRRRRRTAALVILVVIVAAAGGFALAGSRHPATGTAGRESGSAANPGAAAVTSAVAVRNRAAAWIARQVSRDATVACDPVMCAALHSRGFPAANLVPILPARSDPLGAELVAATAALRNQFGARLAKVYAPEVIASFGRGQARIEIRMIPPEGSAAFRRRLGPAGRAARMQGAQLLGNKNIVASAGATAALAGGHVDERLMATLAALASKHAVRIIAFGDANPGAGPEIPFRSADLAGADRDAGLKPAAYRRWLVGFLRAQQAAYRATSVRVEPAPGGPIVRIEFAAPSEIAGPRG